MKNWQLFHEMKADPGFQPRLPARLDYPYGDGINEEEELPKHLKRAKEVASLNRNKMRAIHVAQSQETPFRQGLQERNPMAASQASIDDRRIHYSKSPEARGYSDAQAGQQREQEAAEKEMREWQEFQEFKARKKEYELSQQLAEQTGPPYHPDGSQQLQQHVTGDSELDRFKSEGRQPGHQQQASSNGNHTRLRQDYQEQNRHQPADSIHRQQPSTPKNFDFSPEEIEQMRQRIIEQELERLAQEEQPTLKPPTPAQRPLNHLSQPHRQAQDTSATAPQPLAEYRSRDESLDKNRSEHLKKLNDFYGEFIAEQHKRRQPFTKDDYNYLMSVKHMKRNGIL